MGNEYYYFNIESRNIKEAGERGYHLLIISNPALTGSASSSLTRAGFEVSTSTDYPEVLVRLDELNPDFIVLGGWPVDGQLCRLLLGLLGC